MNKLKNSYFSYFLMINFYYLSWALFSALISVYLMGMGYKPSEVSLVVSASFLASLITQPFIAKLCDRYEAKKVNAVLLVIASVGSIGFMMSESIYTITLFYSLVLLILNGINPIMEKIATSSPYEYGKIRIWGTWGYAAGTQIAGMLYSKVSPQSIFIVFVLMALLCAMGCILTKPNMQVRNNGVVKYKTTDLFKNKMYLYYLLICAVFYAITNMGNTYIPSMLVDRGLDTGIASTVLSLAVFCETPFVLFSGKFMDRYSNKTLLLISCSMVLLQCLTYGLNMPLNLIVLITLLVKHPAGMLYIMINLKVINTLFDEHQQITALAFVATLKNLVSILFQNVAGNILDITTYNNLYLICTAMMIACLILIINFKIEKGTDKKLFG